VTDPADAWRRVEREARIGGFVAGIFFTLLSAACFVCTVIAVIDSVDRWFYVAVALGAAVGAFKLQADAMRENRKP
jgi:hypothetical protein